MTPATGDPPDDVVDALTQLSFLVQAVLARVVAPYDASITQTRLLGVLRDHSPTMQELGAHLGLDKSSISGLVIRAEKRGLVTRARSATDRRAFQVRITADGLELARTVAAEYARQMSILLAGIQHSDLVTLTRLAERIIHHD